MRVRSASFSSAALAAAARALVSTAFASASALATLARNAWTSAEVSKVVAEAEVVVSPAVAAPRRFRTESIVSITPPLAANRSIAHSSRRSTSASLSALAASAAARASAFNVATCALS